MPGPIGFFDPLPTKQGGYSPPEGALSVTRGVGKKPIDFDWVEKNIPCQAACPAGTDIPGYLEAISKKDYVEAYRINLRDNIFPAVLGRVCTRPCEPACRHGWEGLGEPVAICFAKRSADDFMQQEEPMLLEKIFEDSAKSVAIVGGGTSGLALARELTLWGHRVEIFEKHERPGGLMVLGIPEFRLPRDVVAREVEQVLALGIEVHCNHPIDSVDQLVELQGQFDAVVCAFGALRPVWPDIEGINHPNVRHGLDFLMGINAGARPEVGDRVIVVGGGFTSVDCARMGRRLGAKDVKMLYRRSRNETYIYEHEFRCMNEEEIVFEECMAPMRVDLREDGALDVTFARTKPNGVDSEGRASYLADEKDLRVLVADTLLLGTGQAQDWSWLPDSTREALLSTGQAENLFITGDAIRGPGTLIDSIGHAKGVARNVDRFLMNEDRLKEVVVIQDITSTGRTRDMDEFPRQPIPEIGLNDRGVAEEVELGLSEEDGVFESQRCYLCNIKFEIDNDLCIYCDRCLKVMPVDNCIVRVNTLDHDEKGRITGLTESTSSRDYNLLYIDQSACIRCGACAEVCPVDCIPLQRVDKKLCRTQDVKKY